MADQSVERVLTTIFAADVVGYSRMMSSNEEATLRTLKAYRTDIDALIEKHGGNIFGTAGDSVMANFSSTVQAVRSAVAMQDLLRVRNREQDADTRMAFRIGINVGDVMVDHNNFFGDGVNIAARLESIAEPGGVLLSASAYALVQGKLPYAFEDAGAQMVKNIPEPVPTYRVLLDGHPAPAATTPATSAPATPPLASKSSPPSVPTHSGSRRLHVMLVGVLLVGLGAAGAAYFLLGNTARHEFVGMSVQGTARVTSLPFVISLGDNGKAEMAKTINSAGAKSIDPGRWWVSSDNKFCIQFPRFNRGRQVCRTFSRDGGRIAALAGDGKSDSWIIGKPLPPVVK